MRQMLAGGMQQRIKVIDMAFVVISIAYLLCMTVFSSTAFAEPTVETPTNGIPRQGSVHTARSVTFTWDSVNEAGTEITYELLAASTGSTDESGRLAEPNIAQQSSLTTTNVTLDNIPDGQIFWQVRTISSSGETSSWSPVWDFLVDATAPNISMNTFANDPTRPVIEGYTDDGAAVVTIFIDGLAQGNANTSSAANEYGYYWGFNLQKALPYGSYTVRALATDPYGNSTMASQLIMITPPPIAEISEAPDFAVSTLSVGGLAVPIKERRASRSAINDASSSLDLQQAILGDVSTSTTQSPSTVAVNTTALTNDTKSGSLKWVLAAAGIVFVAISGYIFLRVKT